MTLARSKFNAKNFDATDVYTGQDSHKYKSEMQIISRINTPGVLWGLGGGIAAFVFLNRGPKMVARYMQRRSAVYRLHNPVESPFTKEKNKENSEGGPIFRVSMFLANVALSVWWGSSISVWKTNTKEVYDALAKLPLVDGRSLISDTFCKDYTAEYHCHSKEFWNNTQDARLITISRFVQNCRRRAEYEKKLRAESGLSPDEPVSIPAPGVPSDLELPSDGDEPKENISKSFDEFYQPDFSKDDFHDSSKELDTWHSFDDFDGKKSSSEPNSKRM